MRARRRLGSNRFHLALVAAALLALVVPVLAWAHVERPGYWPDPRPDPSVNPSAGGAVPKSRSLSSSLDEDARGQTRVVCKPDSMDRLDRSIDKARENGYRNRPSELRQLSAERAENLRRINRDLDDMCRFSNIQAAVTASGNNDRVVVMPGLYLEQPSRNKPSGDPACDKYKTIDDRPPEGNREALSYAYQFHCPNDQNLIAVMGRTAPSGGEPDPPRWDRHGIPNLGRCIRCNFQIEGSGVNADDVVIEAGSAAAGNGGPSGVGSKKDVGIRADRADGFVLRNMTFRHAGEHGIYMLESDGYRLERFKAFYNKLYGVLTFMEDHGLMQHCEAKGHGDSGVYPGAAAETGHQRRDGTRFRLNQEIRRCDLHHNLAGYSGTNGNAVHLRLNRIYDNALGIQTDVVTGAGHPGYPGNSARFERNRIYSNNFNAYEDDSDVHAAFPFPVGTGMWIAGGNHHVVRRNRIYDNWRRGTMVFAVPDALICGPDSGNEQKGCNPNKVSTSHFNTHLLNTMGVAPGGQAKPNGTDFWWDGFGGNEGNCWFRNSGAGPVTTDPPFPLGLPNCNNGEDPDSSVGTGPYPDNELELLRCLAAFASDFYDPTLCPWFTTPPKPGSPAGRAARERERAEEPKARQELADFCKEFETSSVCEPSSRP